MEENDLKMYTQQLFTIKMQQKYINNLASEEREIQMLKLKATEKAIKSKMSCIMRERCLENGGKKK